MKGDSIAVFALGTSPEWLILKNYLRSQNLKFSVLLFFEKDWKEFQMSKLNWCDSSVNTLTIVNNETVLRLDYFIQDCETPNICCEKHLQKFYKSLSPSKKYVEWGILIKDSISKVVIELDFSICPRTCENFWQICIKHSKLSYVNTKFHRSVLNTFIEGGLIQSDIKSIYHDYFLTKTSSTCTLRAE